MPNKTNSIESIRSNLNAELDSGVHKPIAEWQGTYAAVKQEAKSLAKLANVYGKNEASMHKAFEKRDKAGQSENVKEAKLSKLADTASSRATGYEVGAMELCVTHVRTRQYSQQTAKVAYESAAPSVVTKCQQLLRQRDQLQISLFSTFAISGDALQRMVTMRPDEVHVTEQSGKLPTDASLPYNTLPPHADAKEPSYAPPAYMGSGYAPSTPSPTR